MFTAYAKINGVDGEARAKGFEKQIEVLGKSEPGTGPAEPMVAASENNVGPDESDEPEAQDEEIMP